MQELFNEILPKLADYKGRIFGSLIGLTTGLLWAFLGFWRALAFIFCLTIGYFIGKRMDNKESIQEILDRVLPPKN